MDTESLEAAPSQQPGATHICVRVTSNQMQGKGGKAQQSNPAGLLIHQPESPDSGV